MIIQSFPSGPFETNAYVIACPVTRQAAIIDPAPKSADSILKFLKENNLTAEQILLTHSHWDHIADVAALKKVLPLTVAVHKRDEKNLREPGSDRLRCWVPVEGVEADRFLEEGDVLTLGQITLKVIATPGHSPGSVCFYSEGERVLFSGDTLFKGSIGNLSFPTAVPDEMWPSLDKLAALPLETRVYPGHGPSTTIESESWLARAKEVFGN